MKLEHISFNVGIYAFPKINSGNIPNTKNNIILHNKESVTSKVFLFLKLNNGTSREIGFIGNSRHRAQTNNIKHKTEH
jgi:hypothetical protein